MPLELDSLVLSHFLLTGGVLFVLGLGLIAYIVYLSFASKPKAEDPA